MMDWKLTHAFLPLVLIASACGGKDSKSGTDTDTGSDTDTGATNTCTETISLTSPNSSSLSSAYYRTPIVISFKNAEQGKVASDFATLKDSSGTAVNLGTATWNSDKQVTFDQHDPLSPSTAYTLSVTSSCNSKDFTFTTSDVGAALADPNAVVGNTYAVNIADPGVTVIQPASVGSLLSSLLPQLGNIAIDIVPKSYDSGAQTLTFYGGVVKDGAQDMCQATLDFSANPADFSGNPYFELDAPNGITISYSGYDIPIDALKLGGSFKSDASGIVGITLDGSVDARKLGSILGSLLGPPDTSSPDDGVCALLGNLGVACEACPSDSQPYCLHLVVANIPADEATPGLVEVTDTDVAADTDCAAAAAN